METGLCFFSITLLQIATKEGTCGDFESCVYKHDVDQSMRKGKQVMLGWLDST